MSYISQRHQDNLLPAELRAEGQMPCPTMPGCPQELWPDVDKSEATKASTKPFKAHNFIGRSWILPSLLPTSNGLRILLSL